MVNDILKRFYNHLIAILTGLKYLISPNVRITLKYPDEMLLLPDSYRGMLKLNEDICIGCGLCSQICPAKAIKFKTFEYESSMQIKRHPEVDYRRCIFCGFCADICPSKAIESTKVHDAAFYVQEELYYDITKLISGPNISPIVKTAKYVKSKIDEVRGIVYEHI